jgi:hypothetical protein
MQIETEHAVLFLSDSAPDISIPPDTGRAFVTTTNDCICFWVLSYVDGVSLVTLTDRDCEAGGLKLFSGSIDIPSGVVTLSDSSSFRYINVPVPAGRLPIDLWADHDKYPKWVWVKLGAIRPI